MQKTKLTRELVERAGLPSSISMAATSESSGFSPSMKSFMALRAITVVVATSNEPPMMPPTSGTALPRLITPFSPHFVRRRKPIL